jgi:hypothetical protein
MRALGLTTAVMGLGLCSDATGPCFEGSGYGMSPASPWLASWHRYCCSHFPMLCVVVATARPTLTRSLFHTLLCFCRTASRPCDQPVRGLHCQRPRSQQCRLQPCGGHEAYGEVACRCTRVTSGCLGGTVLLTVDTKKFTVLCETAHALPLQCYTRKARGSCGIAAHHTGSVPLAPGPHRARVTTQLTDPS